MAQFTLPTIISFDGFPVMSGSGLSSHLAARGYAATVSAQVASAFGINYLTLPSSAITYTLLNFDAVSDYWFGVTICAGNGSTGTFSGVGTRNAAGVYTALVAFNTASNTINVYVNNGGTPAITVSGNLGDFVEVHVTSTEVELYVNGAATPVATASVSTDPATMFSHSSQTISAQIRTTGWGNGYVNTTRFPQGKAMVLVPASVVTNTGELQGGATDAIDALAINVPTKSIVFEPTELATLGYGTPITDNPVAFSAVQVTAFGRKTGTAFLPETIYVNGESVGNPVLGIGHSPAIISMVNDPSDSEPWNKAKLNALTVGVGSE